MQRNRVAGVALAATLTVALAGCAGSTEGAESGSVDEIELVYASFIPEDDPNSLTAQRWMDEVTERTDGKVTFETNFGASLCEGPEMLSCVQSGRADVGSMSLSYFPSELSLFGLAAVPFQTSNLDTAIHASYDYAQEDEVQEELSTANLHLLYVGPAAPPILGTREPVDSLSDVEGKSIRALGVLGTSVDELGWSPVDISANELYEAMERGTIDGALFPVNGMVGYRLVENTDYFYDMGRYIGVNDNTLTTINDDVWSSLSAETQEIVTEVSQEVLDTSIASEWAPSAERDCEELLGTAEEFAEMPDADRLEEWSASQLENQRANWVEGVEGRTDDAEALVSAYESLVEKHSELESPSPADICLEMAG